MRPVPDMGFRDPPGHGWSREKAHLRVTSPAIDLTYAGLSSAQSMIWGYVVLSTGMWRV